MPRVSTWRRDSSSGQLDAGVRSEALERLGLDQRQVAAPRRSGRRPAPRALTSTASTGSGSALSSGAMCDRSTDPATRPGYIAGDADPRRTRAALPPRAAARALRGHGRDGSRGRARLGADRALGDRPLPRRAVPRARSAWCSRWAPRSATRRCTWPSSSRRAGWSRSSATPTAPRRRALLRARRGGRPGRAGRGRRPRDDPGPRGPVRPALRRRRQGRVPRATSSWPSRSSSERCTWWSTTC